MTACYIGPDGHRHHGSWMQRDAGHARSLGATALARKLDAEATDHEDKERAMCDLVNWLATNPKCDFVLIDGKLEVAP